jgi:glycosyltransferase involved in cell wall biosynthesis
LQRKTHRCHVFVLEKDGYHKRTLNELGVSVCSGGLDYADFRRAPWKLILSQWKLINVIRRLRPQIVHSFLPLATFMGAMAGRVTGVPLIITSRRALAAHQERHPILKWLDRFANYWSHTVTVNSKAVREDTIQRDHIDPSKLQLIYNGLDAKLFEDARSQRETMRRQLEIKNHELMIISIANLIPYKGHADLIEAAQQVIKAIPESRLVLVGEDRGIQKNLEDRVKVLGISKRVMFLGRRDDVPALLAAGDLFVLSSHEEGFSNVVLESMASGLPVVATDVGGNREAILDGVTGWLTPPKDPANLADKMISALSEPSAAKLRGNEGRLRVNRLFPVEKMIDDHLRLYGLK